MTESERIIKTLAGKGYESAKYSDSIYGTQEEMMEHAKEGYIVRDPKRNLVYCPNGEILRQKCIKKNENIRYVNKNVCRHCPNREKMAKKMCL